MESSLGLPVIDDGLVIIMEDAFRLGGMSFSFCVFWVEEGEHRRRSWVFEGEIRRSQKAIY